MNVFYLSRSSSCLAGMISPPSPPTPQDPNTGNTILMGGASCGSKRLIDMCLKRDANLDMVREPVRHTLVVQRVRQNGREGANEYEG